MRMPPVGVAARRGAGTQQEDGLGWLPEMAPGLGIDEALDIGGGGM